MSNKAGKGADMSHTNISPLPWTYKQSEGAFGKRDWIEDANGDIQLEAVGHLDGPFICEAVNSHDRLTAEVGRLREALEPFAKFACDTPHIGEPDCFNCKARKALNPEEST